MLKGRFNVVIGAQAGSESKGKLAAVLADRFEPRVIAGSFSPNAGHTAYINGEKKVSYHIPVAAAGRRNVEVLLGPASVIRVPTLLEEIEELDINPDNLSIDPRAVLITDEHIKKEEEKLIGKDGIGSTAQGVGMARCAKLMRGAKVKYAGDEPKLAEFTALGSVSQLMSDALEYGKTVLYEMTQGFDLCLEHGIHRRYCTSRVINPAMALAEMGLPVHWLGHVYGVFRPYPIRVNSRGGDSGPYAEAKEISWEDVTKRSGSKKPIAEITTTTKLPRRVFEFSWKRFERFIEICDPDMLCLQFANYLDAKCYGATSAKELGDTVDQYIKSIEARTAVPIAYVGTSPEAMVDLKVDRWGLDTRGRR